MSLKDLSKEKISEMALLEISFEILAEQNKSEDYHSLLHRAGEVKGISEEQIMARISHLYTEMSVDGRFVNLGDNSWGLRSWYSFDQTEEELSQAATKARKEKARELDEDDDLFVEAEDFDEFEDLVDELDELASEEDTDYDEVSKVDEDDFAVPELEGEEDLDEEDEDEDR